jgi:predicted nucleotidyltransferase
MGKKLDAAEIEEENDDTDDNDLDSIRDTVYRAILKNNRLMLRQNELIIEQLNKE